MHEEWVKDLLDTDPLERTAERELIIRYKQTGDIEARNKLILSNMRFVMLCVNLYFAEDVYLPDMLMEGAQGLIDAIEKYDLNHDVKLITYAIDKIRLSITNYLLAYSNPVKFPGTIKDYENKKVEAREDRDDREGHYLKRTLPDDETYQEELESLSNGRMVGYLLSLVSGEYREVLEMYYLEDTCLVDIGVYFGISDERVRQIKEEAIDKIRSRLLMISSFKKHKRH